MKRFYNFFKYFFLFKVGLSEIEPIIIKNFRSKIFKEVVYDRFCFRSRANNCIYIEGGWGWGYEKDFKIEEITLKNLIKYLFKKQEINFCIETDALLLTEKDDPVYNCKTLKSYLSS